MFKLLAMFSKKGKEEEAVNRFAQMQARSNQKDSGDGTFVIDKLRSQSVPQKGVGGALMRNPIKLKKGGDAAAAATLSQTLKDRIYGK